MSLREIFGNIDIYVFDQLLKGRIQQHHKILDAGCGGGRNLIYFLKNEYEVFAVDQKPEAMEQVRHLAQVLAPKLPVDHFQLCPIEKIPFDPESFDWIICNAVFHFAQHPAHFEAMLLSLWEQLKPGGVLFARLATDIGIEDKVEPLGNQRFRCPDGSEWFLSSEKDLLRYTQSLGGILLDPIKTTNVQNLRAMTTWVLQKESY